MVERQNWEEKYKRSRADYINLERRIKKQQEEFVRLTNSVLILKLLPIVDDLEKALRASKDEGLKLILKNLREVLKSEGVTELGVGVGDKFDPKTMEGVQHGSTEGSTEAQKAIEVVEVSRKGYQLRGKVIRPVQVRVR